MAAQLPRGLGRGAPSEALDEVGVKRLQNVGRELERPEQIELGDFGE